jgi:Subtilase family
MEEGVWRARRAALCTDRGVVSCDTDFCESDLAEEDTAPTTVSEAPPAASTSAGAAPAPAVAAPTGPLLTARVQSEDGTARANVRVLLLPRPPDITRVFSQEGPQPPINPDTLPGPGAASCPEPAGGRQALPLMRTSGADGTFALVDARNQIGERACWDVVAVDGCHVRRVPLTNYLADFEPRRLLVLLQVPAADQGQTLATFTAFAVASQLRVLDATALPAINRTLVRLETVNPQADLDAAITLITSQPAVDSAQRDYRYTVTAHTDPFAWMNYGARLTGADQLQRMVSGKGVAVAVIDTGVDADHPELAGRVIERIDVTGYGTAGERHGTAIAGLIGAAADNGVGAYGMAPEAQIISIKACQPESRGTLAARCWSSTLAKALDAALTRPARIINLSLSGPKDPLLEKLVNAALASNHLLVAAAGNSGPDGSPSYPAAYPGVLAVGAIDSRQRLWRDSTRGAFVGVTAPGVSVPVPVPGETYPAQLSGTSMAAAHVSGVAALMQQVKPDAPGRALRDALLATRAAPAPGDPGRVDGCAAALRLGLDASACAPALPGPAATSGGTP